MLISFSVWCCILLGPEWKGIVVCLIKKEIGEKEVSRDRPTPVWWIKPCMWKCSLLPYLSVHFLPNLILVNRITQIIQRGTHHWWEWRMSSRIIYSWDAAQHYDGRKPIKPRLKSSTISRLLGAFPNMARQKKLAVALSQFNQIKIIDSLLVDT